MKSENVIWSLDRKVTVAGVVAVLMLAASILGVYIRQDTRITSMEIALTYQKGVNDQLKESQKDIKVDTARSIDEVKGSIDKLSNKIDKLLERK
jgi:hypothetical protein